MYELEEVHKQAHRVLNDYTSCYRVISDTVSKPTLYVSRLKAIAAEAYQCHVNENPKYINVMKDRLSKPYGSRSGYHAKQWPLRLGYMSPGDTLIANHEPWTLLSGYIYVTNTWR